MAGARRRRGQPRLLSWPAEASVAAAFDARAVFSSERLLLARGEALAAAADVWPERSPPRTALLRAHRANAAPSLLDRAAFARMLHHVVVGLELVAVAERSASAAWRVAASTDDCRLTLQEFAGAALALGCECPAAAAAAGSGAEPAYLERCAAVFSAMPSHDGGYVLLEELVTWAVPQRLRNHATVAVRLRPALDSKTPLKSPQPGAGRTPRLSPGPSPHATDGAVGFRLEFTPRLAATPSSPAQANTTPRPRRSARPSPAPPPAVGTAELESSKLLARVSRCGVATMKVTAVRQRLKAHSYGGSAGKDPSKLFKHFDRENTGDLTFQKFRAVVRKVGRMTSAEISDKELQKVFDSLDVDGSGDVGVAELTAFVWASASAVSPASTKHSGSTGKAARNRREQTAAAVAIQKSWRASSDRADLTRSLSREATQLRQGLEMDLETDEADEALESAAVKIQAVIRGSSARRLPSLPDDSSSSEDSEEEVREDYRPVDARPTTPAVMDQDEVDSAGTTVANGLLDAAASVTVLRLAVPAGKSPRDTMHVPIPGGQAIAFEVPDGCQPGDEFEAELPTEVAALIDTDADGVITEEELAEWTASQARGTALGGSEQLKAPHKQLSKRQVREMVRIQLELTGDQREASDAWIDARFDRFDADGNGTMDDREWDSLLKSLAPVVIAMSAPRPWGVVFETNQNSALAVYEVGEGSVAERAGVVRGLVLTSVNGARVDA